MSLLREKPSAARAAGLRAASPSVSLKKRLTPRYVADRLLGRQTFPALPKILALIASDEVTITEPPVNPAQEVLSTWAPRLLNVILIEKRVLGLKALVQALRELPSDEPIEQINVFAKRRTGIVFFGAKSGRLIGAIFSIQSDVDERRSRANFLAANGVSA